MSLRLFAAVPERSGPGGVELLADSDVVSGVEEGSDGGWLAASGLREAHPESTVSTETNKTTKSADLREPISRVATAVGSIGELCRWWDCCGSFAAFTGGP